MWTLITVSCKQGHGHSNIVRYWIFMGIYCIITWHMCAINELMAGISPNLIIIYIITYPSVIAICEVVSVLLLILKFHSASWTCLSLVKLNLILPGAFQCRISKLSYQEGYMWSGSNRQQAINNHADSHASWITQSSQDSYRPRYSHWTYKI